MCAATRPEYFRAIVRADIGGGGRRGEAKITMSHERRWEEGH